MPRRSWRDLDRSDATSSSALQHVPTQGPPRGVGDLDAAAAMVPDSRLAALMQERRTLENRLRNLTGLPGQPDAEDAHRDARFQVPTFAERQAEIRHWEAQRQARMTRHTQDLGRGSERWASTPELSENRPPAMPLPSTALGATGLADGMSALRSGISERSRATRESLLSQPREVAGALEEAGRPVREIGTQLVDQDRQFEDMDRKLAAEGIDATERQEIREAVSSDAIDKVSGVLERVNNVIDAPRKAVAKIEEFWQRSEQQISGPMDRFSGYAAERERRLSTETGGSGDLFERMQANRMNALRRRQESRMQERRDERRRERAAQRRAGES